MGNIKMAVLTKSSKYGNNCVAGIDLSNGDWVRLVTEDEASHGAVSDNDLICEDGRSVEVLDVIDAPILGRCNDCVQPENVLLDLDTYIEIKGRMTLDEVLRIHPLERKRNILGNDYGYITEARVSTVGYSLVLCREKVQIKSNQFSLCLAKLNLLFLSHYLLDFSDILPHIGLGINTRNGCEYVLYCKMFLCIQKSTYMHVYN